MFRARNSSPPIEAPAYKPNAEGEINRVLQAERAVREAMLECDQQADCVLREARERARRIRQRAEQRIQRWYLNSERYTAERVRNLEDQGQALSVDPSEPSRLTGEWGVAVRRLTSELIDRTR